MRAQRLSEQQASALLPLCNNGGAALFLSMIGATLLDSFRVGAALYGIHIVSALLLAWFFRPSVTAQPNCRIDPPSPSLHFVAAVQDAAQTALTVSAFIIVFSVITQAIGKIRVLSPMLTGILELSGGCYFATTSGLPISQRAALCSLFAGWGGLCVYAQTAAVCDGLSIDFGRYLVIKLLHGFLAFALTIISFAVYSRIFLAFP